VLAKFGVPPNRIIDYLTLIGDTVDNVPGVSKCGPKTALKWLALHGSLDGVIENAAQHRRRGRREPARALEWLPQGRELITVKTDCDLMGHMVSIEETLVAAPEDKDALRDFFERYGFKTMLRELTGTPARQRRYRRRSGGPAEFAGRRGRTRCRACRSSRASTRP
jgi:DNA polymerase-1